ncbi:MAG TPA: hypothetical protein VFG72_06110 [Marmoricola sp.]|nr:hypothetical protein [Marmoricola sp.]
MSGYSILLPPPWHRVHLGASRGRDVRRAMDRATARAPKEIPPDQRATIRRRLEAELVRQLDAVEERGGRDFYFPAHDLDGVGLNASFVVSAVVPGARAEAGAVGGVLATLVGQGGEPVSVDDTVWVRTESVVEGDGDAQAALRARQVDYLAAVPGDERRWVLVTCTVLGDGDPDSLPTGLVVELFDAIMSTWRWQRS